MHTFTSSCLGIDLHRIFDADAECVDNGVSLWTLRECVCCCVSTSKCDLTDWLLLPVMLLMLRPCRHVNGRMAHLIFVCEKCIHAQCTQSFFFADFLRYCWCGVRLSVAWARVFIQNSIIFFSSGLSHSMLSAVFASNCCVRMMRTENNGINSSTLNSVGIKWFSISLTHSLIAYRKAQK